MAALLTLFDGHTNSYDPQADRRTMDKDICDHMVVIDSSWWPSMPVQEAEMVMVCGRGGRYCASEGSEALQTDINLALLGTI